MRRLLLLIALCCSASLTQARSGIRQLADSLLQQLPLSKEDTNKVKLLDTISMVFHEINPDSGIVYGDWGKRLSESLEWKRGIAKAHLAIGLNYEASAQNSEALENYQIAARLFEELGDPRTKATALGNIGNVYTSIGKFATALEYDSISLSIYENIRNREGQLRTLGNIALVYQAMKKFSKAHQFFTMALDMGYRYRDTSEVAKNLGNLAALNADEGDMRGAIKFCEQAIRLYDNGYPSKGLASNVANMGIYYYELAIDSTTPFGVRSEYFGKAESYLLKGLDLCRQISYRAGELGCYQSLADLYEKMGSWKQAHDYTSRYFTLKDSIFSSNTALKIAKLEAINQAENKKRQILLETIKKRDERFLYISGIAILVLIIIVVVRNFVKQVRSNRQMAVEKTKHLEKIKVQSNVLMDIAHIQSHEIRGPVSTILGLSQLFNFDDLGDPVNKELMEGISTLAERLDKIVTDVVVRENKLMKDTLEGDLP